MSDYSRSECQVSYGATSALQDPDLDKTLVSTPSSPTHYKHVKLTVGTSEEVIDLSEFTTIQELYVKNHDATSFVLAKGRVLTASKTFATNELGFVDGGAGVADTITDTGSTFLTSLYFKAGDYAVVTGATDTTANNTTFGPLTAAVAGTITVPTAQVTAEAAEAGLVTMKNHSPFTLRVEGADAGWAKLTNVVPGNDLTLISDESSTVEVIVIGT
jgi:hypothetical protein